MMLFRNAYNPEFKPSPEQMQASIQLWQEWVKGIAVQGKFVSTSRLGFEGKILKPNNIVTVGPYAEIKEITGGYIIVKAATIDEALILAEGCPVLQIGGNVEIRNMIQMN